MKIAIATTHVPFTRGGAEIHAEALQRHLELRGHEVDIIRVPFKWYPPRRLLDCMLCARLIDLTEVNGARIDHLIAMKFPAYYIDHPSKSLWLLHQHRQAYDLFGTDLSDLWQSQEGHSIAAEIKRWDDEFLSTFPRRFTNSQNVADRLKRFNGIDASALHVPLDDPDDFRPGPFEDFIFYPGRFDSIKRQHLLVDAVERMDHPIRVVFIGHTDSAYGRDLVARINRSPKLRQYISVLGLVPHEKKLELYSTCSAVYNGVVDEDYGYLTLEGFYSAKPVITHSDSGGPLEFVRHGRNGWILPPDAISIASCLAKIASDRSQAQLFGQQGLVDMQSRSLSWDHVVTSLLP